MHWSSEKSVTPWGVPTGPGPYAYTALRAASVGRSNETRVTGRRGGGRLRPDAGIPRPGARASADAGELLADREGDDARRPERRPGDHHRRVLLDHRSDHRRASAIRMATHGRQHPVRVVARDER